MTDSLRPQYLGLFSWALAIYGSCLLPLSVRQWALDMSVLGFVVWFIWSSQRTPREIRRHLEVMASQRRVPQDTDEMASAR